MLSRVTHKCGVELLITASQDKKLDENNNNSLWMDVSSMHMENIKVDFDILEDGAKIPVVHDKASSQLVFDPRMTLERKARWFKDGHKNPDPKISIFSSAVSMQSTCIA